MSKAVKERETTEISEFERLLNESYDYNFKIAEVVEGTIMKVRKKRHSR